MPSLFPLYILSKLKTIITDGYPQEFLQRYIARENVYKIALRIRYSFHLVRTGWAHHIMKKNCFAASIGYFYYRVCNLLKKWIYSWMKNSFETREQYLVFKLIFKKGLNSKQMKSKHGISFIENVENFVTKHIGPHETHFCFYLRLNLRHFEKYTDFIQEVINRGLKYNSAPVDPSTNIKKSFGYNV